MLVSHFSLYDKDIQPISRETSTSIGTTANCGDHTEFVYSVCVLCCNSSYIIFI